MKVFAVPCMFDPVTNAYGPRIIAVPVLNHACVPVAGISLPIDAGCMNLGTFVEQAEPEVRRIAVELTRALRHAAGTIPVGPL